MRVCSLRPVHCGHGFPRDAFVTSSDEVTKGSRAHPSAMDTSGMSDVESPGAERDPESRRAVSRRSDATARERRSVALRPLPADALVDELQALGCHPTDIGDAFSAADPEW